MLKLLHHKFGIFVYPIIVSIVALLCMLGFVGWQAFVLTLVLAVLEITFSFENAVINAAVLKDMSPLWQKRFLVWGILLAVFGTRIILPVLIVSVVAGILPWAVAVIAVVNPAEYAHLIESMHAGIAAFGSAFLGLVALRYFFDDEKHVHWVHVLENRFARWGHIEAVEIAIVLSLLSIITIFVPDDRATILMAGIVGVVLFVAMQGVIGTMKKMSRGVATGGLAGFLYLETLDSAFSLDGVIGAFAITTDILIIAVGLGIGAYFVRSLTVHLVRSGALSTLKYLEHGAHWAVFGLAVSMGLSLVMHVPELITAGVGVVLIAASYLSSVKHK